MKNLSLKLPDSLADRLEELASRQWTSTPAVREAISAPAPLPPWRVICRLDRIQDLEDLSVNPGHLAGYGA